MGNVAAAVPVERKYVLSLFVYCFKLKRKKLACRNSEMNVACYVCMYAEALLEPAFRMAVTSSKNHEMPKPTTVWDTPENNESGTK